MKRRKAKIRLFNRSSMDLINKHIEKLSLRAFENAKKETLQRGLSIVVKERDGLYRIYPNGKKEFIKKVKPNIKVNSKKSFYISYD